MILIYLYLVLGLCIMIVYFVDSTWVTKSKSAEQPSSLQRCSGTSLALLITFESRHYQQATVAKINGRQHDWLLGFLIFSSSSLRNCRNNMPTYNAIDGKKIFDLEDKLNITKVGLWVHVMCSGCFVASVTDTVGDSTSLPLATLLVILRHFLLIPIPLAINLCYW